MTGRAALAALLLAAVACSGGGNMSPDGGGGAPNTAVMGGRPAAAGPIFDDSRLHELSLEMAPEDWQSILDDSRADEWRHATLTYDGVKLTEVGVRPSGESSRFPGNAKMSMRIRFDAFPAQGKFDGVDVFQLKGQLGDQSMMRDQIAFWTFRQVTPAPRSAHAVLTVNGELRGVYAVIEVWESDSLKQHYSEPLGALYRLRGVVGTDPYAYVGDSTGAYVPLPWEQHLAHPGSGDDKIPPFLKMMADAPGNLDQVAGVDQLLAYLAASTLVMDTDGLPGDTGVEDHYQYFDPATGKFFVLPWDPDNTFGANNEMPDRKIYARFSKSRILTIVRDYGDLRARYKAKIKEVMAAIPLATMQAEIDRTYQQIAAAAHADPFKGFDNDTFDWNPNLLKNFAAARYASVADQVENGP